MDVSFSLGQYDRDGDLWDSGVFLWINYVLIRFEDVNALENFGRKILEKIVPEVRETAA
jgi:hypothetical protein